MEEQELEEKAKFIRENDYLVNKYGDQVVDEKTHEEQLKKFTFLNR